MGRPERPLDPNAGPLQRFALGLRELREAAGRPSYRELAKRTNFSVTTLSEAAGGFVVPSLPVVLAYVAACGGDRDAWEARWRALVRRLSPASATEAAAGAPYLGLATFETTDAKWFFGREKLVAQLCETLCTVRFLALFAPSGTGKSSVLRAGLLPALDSAHAAGSPSRRQRSTILMTPGERPAAQLTDRLSGVDPDAAELLLVVDQFEEVFTLCQDEQERSRFIAALLARSEDPDTRVVLGVRADFYGRCAAYPALVAALRDRQVLIGPMDDDDLRRVVTGPAADAGLTVEAALVEVAVADASGQPGALPLLSHALLETWRLRRRSGLTLADYRAVGGVRGAIAGTAERAYAEFDANQQRVVREVFLRLTALGEGTQDTRRRATTAELLHSSDAVVTAEVLDRLAAARLITVAEDSVTVAHEALIHEWPRLRGWLADDRELLLAHRRLTDAAREWEQHGHDDGYLYRGARLAGWVGPRTDRLNAVEQKFLAASRRREARERRSARRRVQLAVTALATVVVLVATLAGVALVQAQRAGSERDLAVSQRLAAEARNRLPLDPEGALTLARQAFAIAPTAAAESVLRQAFADHRVRAVHPLGVRKALGVVFSPDGTRLAATGTEGTVKVWSWRSGQVFGLPLVLTGHDGDVWSPAFSPDGRLLATAGRDGTVRVWPVDATGPPVTLRGHAGPVWAVTFSPDGRQVASAGDDRTVRVWNVADAGAPRTLHGHEQPATGVGFSPDGRWLASGSHDRTVRIWDLTGPTAPTVLRGPQAGTKVIAFTADGARLVAGSSDGTAWVWQRRGSGAPVVLRGHRGTVEGLAVSRDGEWIATSSDDTTVRVWNANGTGDPLVLPGHRSTVWAVAFSPDGTRLASVGEDGMVRIWDPRGAGDPVWLRHAGAVWASTFSPDGKQVISGGEDRCVRIWDPARGTEQLVLRGHDNEVLGLTVSADGRRVASGSRDGTVRVWDLANGGDPVVLRGHDGPAWIGALSPDGRLVASPGRDGTLRIWDATGRQQPLVRRVTGSLRYAVFSPDGRHVATGGEDGTVRIWDTTGAAQPRVLGGHEGLVWAVAFSPDGRSVASTGNDGTVRIWPVSGSQPPQILRGHRGFVWYVDFSPDGQWVVSTGKDGTVHLWPTAGAASPVVYSGFGASVEAAQFSPDGTRLVTTHDDGTARVWTCTACGPIERLLG